MRVSAVDASGRDRRCAAPAPWRANAVVRASHAARAREDYLRFTLLSRSPDSGRKQGALCAAYWMRDDDDLPHEEYEALQVVLAWFDMHLDSPSVLREPGNDRALSWFKSRAREPLRRMWQLREIYRAQGVFVEVHRTRDPGLILYEDGWQVVAKPWRDQRAGW